MSNFTKRIVTGIGLLTVITSLVVMGHFGFLLLILLINTLGLLEFYRLFHSDVVKPVKIGGILLSDFTLLAVHFILIGFTDNKLILAVIPIAFLLFVVELYKKAEQPFFNLAFTFLGIICITLPLVFFNAIGFFPLYEKRYHPNLVLGYFFLLWASDSGAYLFGRMAGRHKLFERISPKKTWEGSIGGTVSAIIIAWVNAQLFKEANLLEWLVMAVIIVIIGSYGDLIKSMMKRSLHIKDSGTILPGHGGILDRFDTLLSSAPFVWMYLFICH